MNRMGVGNRMGCSGFWEKSRMGRVRYGVKLINQWGPVKIVALGKRLPSGEEGKREEEG